MSFKKACKMVMVNPKETRLVESFTENQTNGLLVQVWVIENKGVQFKIPILASMKISQKPS